MFIGEVVETGVIEPLVVLEVADGNGTADAERADEATVAGSPHVAPLVPLDAA